MKMRKITLTQSIIPIVFLIVFLGLNVFVFKDDATYGSNQIALLLSAAVATAVGFFNGVSFKSVMEHVSSNIKDTTPAILILLFVGALTGSWLISGIVPGMIYYGLQM